jgi:hypothetical protein
MRASIAGQRLVEMCFRGGECAYGCRGIVG